MKITTSVQLALAAAGAAFVALSGAVLFSYAALRDSNEQRQQLYAVVIGTAELQIRTNEYLDNFSARPLRQWRARDAAITAALKNIEPSAIASPQEIASLRARHSEISQLFFKMQQLGMPGEDRLRRMQQQLLIDRLIVMFEEQLGEAARVRQNTLQADQHSMRRAAMVGALVLALLTCIFLAALYVVRRNLSAPLQKLVEATETLGGGDLSHRIGAAPDNEIGALSQAVNTMAARLQNVTASRDELENAREALRAMNATLEFRIAERTLDLEKAHEQLRQSQKLEAVGQLTGGVAHDFNNVLQVISGNLQLLHMNLAGNPQARQRLEHASFAADRGAKLSSQLLAFARRQPLQPVASNLARVLRGMDELLRRALGESVQIETIVAGGLWNTLVDPNQLENVILNLAINARDAMEGEGKLTLELGNAMLDDQYAAKEGEVIAGQYVVLVISDTGMGMSPEVQARVFEPFFTTKREGQGTGLGLSMAYGFIKQSNGHIKIYSEVGNGTTIKIYLPRSHQMEVEVVDIKAVQAVGGNETILVVEDDMSVQATAVDMLSGLGYRVLKANDGQSALTILQSGISIDLVFTDVVMPGPIRSPDLARHAKQLFPDIAVLFTSGYTQNAIVHGGRLDPGVELISKPYRRDDLARKIRHILASQAHVSNLRQRSDKDSETVKIIETGSSIRVLVVEDNPDANTILCELLTMLGHHARGVENAKAALELFAIETFDVLLTDISLPGMSGIELARQLVKENSSLKVIFSSGYGAVSEDEFEYAAGSLPKPYDLIMLQGVIEQVVSS